MKQNIHHAVKKNALMIYLWELQEDFCAATLIIGPWVPFHMITGFIEE